ncbi:membrane protein [Rhodopirellula maiorica SM1]|uniref:Membrane protein n=1 Tax=Rhodopirellula maiorica SM1 TaxID=1265738 RepID=M5RCE2_9BACT|nr:hypothetical protein [Rhodopirellula maiorica]EMI16731.1 membrane protein [Rhodopirellula maiorica SM1]
MNRTPIQNPYLASSASESTSGNQVDLKAHLRTSQIIAFALIQGVLFITAIMGYLSIVSGDGGPADGPPADPAADNDMMMLAIGAVAAFGGCFASFVANKMFKAMAIRQFASTGEEVDVPVQESMKITSGISELLATSQTRMIVGMALAEGAAVINAVLMMLDGNLIHLVMIGFCLVAMAVQFPTLQKKLDLIDFAARASRDRV